MHLLLWQMLLQYSHLVCSFVLVVVSTVVEVVQDPSWLGLAEVEVVQVLSWQDLVVAVEVVARLLAALAQGLPHENQAAWLFDRPEDVVGWPMTKNSSSHC